MADATPAIKHIFDLEGTWSNNHLDPGAETVFGISRVFNPSWEGWKIVDQFKAAFKDPVAEIKNSGVLVDMAINFYRRTYWDPLRGDANPSQAIANELMDIAINIKAGKRQAVTFLQRALNGLNRDQKLWPDITEDGIMGKDTLDCIRQAMLQKREAHVVKMINCIQGVYYLEHSQEEFLAGLLRRVSL